MSKPTQHHPDSRHRKYGRGTKPVPKLINCLGCPEPHQFLSPDPKNIHQCPAAHRRNDYRTERGCDQGNVKMGKLEHRD